MQRQDSTNAKIGDTLKNLTGQMNSTIARIKDSIKLLPGKFNLTKVDLESIFDAPFDFISNSFVQIADFLKSMTSIVGVMTVAICIVLIIPALEVVMIGFKLAQIPANLWLGSARRVTCNFRATGVYRRKLTGFFSKRKKRWDDSVRMV